MKNDSAILVGRGMSNDLKLILSPEIAQERMMARKRMETTSTLYSTAGNRKSGHGTLLVYRDGI